MKREEGIKKGEIVKEWERKKEKRGREGDRKRWEKTKR